MLIWLVDCRGWSSIRNGNLTCPVCRKELKETEIYPDNMAKRDILSLKIWCDKREEGCSWMGELREQDRHNEVCGYVTELCGNDCGELVMRKDMDHHQQNGACSRVIVGCLYCKTQLEYGQLVGHYEVCNEYLVDCRHQCGTQIARKDMELHISREGGCPNSPLQCDFSDAGCQFIGNGRNLQDHLDKNTAMQLSLAMKLLGNISKKFTVVEKDLIQTKALLSVTRADYERFKETLDVELRSKTFAILMKDGLKKSLQSEKFMNAALDVQTEMSLEVGNSFVYLWKVDAQQLSVSQKRPQMSRLTSEKQLPTEKCVSSNQFSTGNPGLRLQLELCVLPDAVNYSFRARVYRFNGQHDRELGRSKYLMTIWLVDNHGQRSRISDNNIDFGLPSQAVRGDLKNLSSQDHVFRLDEAFRLSFSFYPSVSII